MTESDKKVVLVADDEEIVRFTVSAFLKHQGFSVLIAENGIEAVKIAEARQGRIDLLLSDIKMPVMTGDVLASIFNDRWPDIKVLLMSGFARDWHNLQWDFIAKPFTAAQLIASVCALLLH